ncbi:MAG: universal stress protein [Ignavibacteria bacterium]|nr:universal stress protein [Ignavibacteria bacterium]
MFFKKILISVDESQFSIEAVKRGVELAKAIGAELGLIHVIDESQTVGNIDAGISPADALKILETETEKLMQGLIDLYIHDLPLTKFTPIGKPAAQIIKTSEQWNADLIVTGTHRTTGWRRLIIGSISEDIIRHSKIPVLVVPLA